MADARRIYLDDLERLYRRRACVETADEDEAIARALDITLRALVELDRSAIEAVPRASIADDGAKWRW